MHPDALCVRTQVYPRAEKIVTLILKKIFRESCQGGTEENCPIPAGWRGVIQRV